MSDNPIPNNALTEYLANTIAGFPPDTVLKVSLFLLAILFIYGSIKLLRVLLFSRKLHSSTKIIQKAEILDFEEIRGNLPHVEKLLFEFEELLLDDNKNSENSEEILSEENVLHTIDVNQESLEHYPGTFTAIGIGGTFIGILFALVPIKNEIEQSDVLIENLLNGAGTAFITSIFGILASITFLVITRFILGSFQNKLFKFRLALNRRLTRFTSTNALVHIEDTLVVNLSEIKDSLAGMADDISEKIGKAVTESTVKAIEGLQNELGKVVQSASGSSQEIVSQVLEGISDTVSTLNQSATTQADMLDYFDNSIKSAKEFAEIMEGLLPDITKASTDFAAASNNIKDLPEALNIMSSQQQQFAETTQSSIDLLLTGWEDERERLTKLQDGLRDQFDKFELAIGDGIETSMEKFDSELSRAGGYIAAWLDDLNKQVGEFSNKTEAFSSIVQNSGSEMQNVIQGFSSAMSDNIGGIESSFGKMSEIFNANIESISNNLSKFPEEINQTLESLRSTYDVSIQLLPEALENSLESMLSSVQDSTEEIRKAYETSASLLPEMLASQFEELAAKIEANSKSKGIFGNFLRK
jgi:ABC-type transporter Mla subunit MlaD